MRHEHGSRTAQINMVDPSGLYGFSDLLNDTKGTLAEVPGTFKWWGRQAIENPGTAAAVVAGTACVFLSAGTCAIAMAAQAGIGVGEAGVKFIQNPKCWRSSLLQAGLSVFPVGIAKGIAKVGSEMVTSELLANEFARAGVRAYATIPWVALTGFAGAAGGCTC